MFKSLSNKVRTAKKDYVKLFSEDEARELLKEISERLGSNDVKSLKKNIDNLLKSNKTERHIANEIMYSLSIVETYCRTILRNCGELNSRIANLPTVSRKARYYDDSDQFELTENLENLVDDLEKNKCFGIKEVIDVDMSLDDYNTVVIECNDPVLIQKIKDANGGDFTGDSVKVVIRVDDGSLILTVEAEEDGEASEYDFIDLGRAYGIKYDTLLDLVKDGINQILN